MPVAESADVPAAAEDSATDWHFSTGMARQACRRLLGIIVLLLPLSAVMSAWHEVMLTTPVLWLAVGSGLLLYLWLLRELQAPAVRWTVHCQQGALSLQGRGGTTQSPPGVGEFMQACRPQLLPGVVVLIGKGRRYWLFCDECSQTAWRRLRLCARFAGQNGVAHHL